MNNTTRPIYIIVSKFNFIKPLCFLILMVTFFFQTPYWCKRRQEGSIVDKDLPPGDVMLKGCERDVAGNVYNLSNIAQLPEFYLAWFELTSIIAQILIILGDSVMIIFVGKFWYRVRIVGMAICIVL